MNDLRAGGVDISTLSGSLSLLARPLNSGNTGRSAILGGLFGLISLPRLSPDLGITSDLWGSGMNVDISRIEHALIPQRWLFAEALRSLLADPH